MEVLLMMGFFGLIFLLGITVIDLRESRGSRTKKLTTRSAFSAKIKNWFYK